MLKKKCKNTLCLKGGFFPKRQDQLFCCMSCRNQFNNEAYKRKKQPYKTVADDLYRQDKVIATIIKKNPQVFIKQEEFKELNIDISKAQQVISDNEGHLQKALFVKYELSHYKQTLFKIKPR